MIYEHEARRSTEHGGRDPEYSTDRGKSRRRSSNWIYRAKKEAAHDYREKKAACGCASKAKDDDA